MYLQRGVWVVVTRVYEDPLCDSGVQCHSDVSRSRSSLQERMLSGPLTHLQSITNNTNTNQGQFIIILYTVNIVKTLVSVEYVSKSFLRYARLFLRYT